MRASEKVKMGINSPLLQFHSICSDAWFRGSEKSCTSTPMKFISSHICVHHFLIFFCCSICRFLKNACAKVNCGSISVLLHLLKCVWALIYSSINATTYTMYKQHQVSIKFVCQLCHDYSSLFKYIQIHASFYQDFSFFSKWNFSNKSLENKLGSFLYSYKKKIGSNFLRMEQVRFFDWKWYWMYCVCVCVCLCGVLVNFKIFRPFFVVQQMKNENSPMLKLNFQERPNCDQLIYVSMPK